jgi:hypothetical protein
MESILPALALVLLVVLLVIVHPGPRTRVHR